jgi:GLPGLI family protein
MKTRMIMSVLAMVLTITSWAQSFEGKISATVKAIALPEEMAGHAAMFNQSMTSYYKGEKSCMEMKNMMGTTTIITDTLKKEVIMLINMMGQKTAIKEPLTDENDDNPLFEAEMEGGKLELKSDTKTIAGYKCKKAVYTMPAEEDESPIVIEFWYTEELDVYMGDAPIPGMMMEYTMSMEGITMQFTVTEIVKEKVDDSKFTIPEGYTVKTKEEFEKQFPKMD